MYIVKKAKYETRRKNILIIIHYPNNIYPYLPVLFHINYHFQHNHRQNQIVPNDEIHNKVRFKHHKQKEIFCEAHLIYIFCYRYLIDYAI